MEFTPVTVSLGIALIGLLLLAVLIGARRRRRDAVRLFTWAQKKMLLHQSRYRCEYKHPLWRRCRQTSRLQADHIVPWSGGGATEIWNGQILCSRHNRRKSNLIPAPLYRWRLDQRRRRYPRT
jgi:5-methylcytosine-specific restriction endonuclease McrA